MDEAFIKDNSIHNIKQSSEIEQNNEDAVIGKLKLRRIIKGKGLKRIANKCAVKETIYYIKDKPLEKDKLTRHYSDERFDKVFKYDKRSGLHGCDN